MLRQPVYFKLNQHFFYIAENIMYSLVCRSFYYYLKFILEMPKIINGSSLHCKKKNNFTLLSLQLIQFLHICLICTSVIQFRMVETAFCDFGTTLISLDR